MVFWCLPGIVRSFDCLRSSVRYRFTGLGPHHRHFDTGDLLPSRRIHLRIHRPDHDYEPDLTAGSWIRHRWTASRCDGEHLSGCESIANNEDIEDNLASSPVPGHDLCAGYEAGTLHEAPSEVGVLRTTYRHSHHMLPPNRNKDPSFQ